MSGPENIRGIDYQINCTLLLLLNALTEDAGFVKATVESLDDDGEDLALEYAEGRRLEIQIKKLAEGYNWTPALLRPVLRRFAKLPGHCECLFLSDGSASRDLAPLKKFLEGSGELAPDLIATLCSEDFAAEELNTLAGRVRIRTRYFPSPDVADPARGVRTEVHRAISGGPFALTGTTADIVARLWALVFETARTAETMAHEDIKRRFDDAGLRPIQSAWSAYPTTKTFYPHGYALNDAAQILLEGGLILVGGIGGSGKSTLLAEAAANASENGRRSCWITLNALVEPADLVALLGQYSHAIGLEDVQGILRSAEPASFAASIAGVIAAFPVSLILDRLEAATPRTQALIESIAAALPAERTRGALVLAGREIPLWWPDVLREKPYALHIPLGALPMSSALSMLRDRAIGDSDEERTVLIERLGAHAQSLFLLIHTSATEVSDLMAVAVDVAHDWLLRRVLQDLPDKERDALSKLSIFAYPAPLAVATAVLDPLGPDSLRSLQRREFVRIDLNKLSVHDAIRGAAAELLAPSVATACHRAAADWFSKEIAQDFASDEFVSFDKSIPWALHLDASYEPNAEGPGRFSIILQADDDILLALFAIDKVGFPFAFGDKDLDQAIALIEELEEGGLIAETPINAGQPRLEGPIFGLVDFSFFDRLLITSLCFHEGLAASLGYIDRMQPNYAFGQQGLCCPWEHCIELSPYPLGSRAEWKAGLEQDRQRLAEPEKHRLTAKHIEVLTTRIAEGVPDWVPEVVDEELRARACFVFGHACPGGHVQASVCRERGHFEWPEAPLNEAQPTSNNADTEVA